MKLAKNYHEYSMYKEKQLYNNLMTYYGDLLVSLNAIKKLDETTINKAIKQWHKEYDNELEEMLKRQVKNLETYSKRILTADEPLSEQADALLEANKVMLNVTTDYVRQKFIEIGVNEKAYGYDSEMVNNLMDEVVKVTADKLETFSIQSTINNLAQFIKKGALDLGYTEYKWHTQRDSKVRPTHVRMDGKWFSIFDESPMPAGYKPGIDWGCRCWMSEFR